MDERLIVALPAGRIEYKADAAAIPIEDLIGALKDAQEDGATHVVQESGNYRGAKWQGLCAAYEWVDGEV